MKKSFTLNLYIIIFFSVLSSILLNTCTLDKKANIIGIHYKKTNPYNEKEIFRDLSKIAFDKNYTIIKNGYEEKPDYKVIKEFYKKKVKIIILEDYSSSGLSKILKYVKNKNILLSLITDKIIPHCHLLNITDFEKLGYSIANELYNFTRGKRNTFVIMYNVKFTNNYRKNKLIKGYNRFINSYNNLNLITNTYKSTNKADFKKKLYVLTGIFSNNLRGILMDNDDVAVKMAYILRRTGKENEIKIAGFNTTLAGIDSMMKTGLVVTGDINRYALFLNAFTNSLVHYTNIMNNNNSITNIIPGAYYHQYNAMDQLSLTKKFSIKQIIN